jgi:serine protease Do
MRLVSLFSKSFLVAAMVLAANPATRADEVPPAPSEGMIGIQLKVDDGKLVIISALEKGPAEKAGIKADDVLLKINDYKVADKSETEDLHNAVKEVGKYKPGEKVKITVKRGEKEMTIEVTVGRRKEIIKD